MRRRRRPRVAFAGLLVVALGSLIGFAAFSAAPGGETTTTEGVLVVRVPSQASGRVTAGILASALGPAPAAPTPTTTIPPTTTAPPTTPAPTTTTTKPPPPATTTTTHTHAPTTSSPVVTTTTHTHAPTTTTTTHAPTTTTTTTVAVTTTTEPPVEGGARNVEEWRTLVELFFPTERVGEALSVIRCESNGDPLAFNSSSSASGLFQFLPGTWGWTSALAGWGGTNVFEPEANIAVAAWLVQDSVDRGKDPWLHWTCKP